MLGQIASTMTSVVAWILAVQLGLRYLRRRRMHTLLYAVSLGLFALAAAADAVAHVAGAIPVVLFRLYWFAAAGLVGMMALGTGTLIVPFTDPDWLGRLGRGLTLAAMAAVTGLLLWLLAAVLLMPVTPEQLIHGPGVLTKAPPGPKAPFVLTNIVGTLLIFAGALWSYWKVRAGYTLLIALGALVFALGGTAASLGGELLFYSSQILGTLVLYTGVSGSLQPRRAPVRDARPGA